MICIAEYDGFVLNADGLDIDALKAHFDKAGTILGFEGGTSVKRKDVTAENEPLCMECDILIPAAKELVINKDNMTRIKAKVIGEAANGPLSFEADEYLSNKGVVVLPDLFLNAGGVCVSYFEWLKNLNHVRWGRMTKRLDGQRGRAVVDTLLDNGIKVSDETADLLFHGASEREFAHSALADSMYDALHQIVENAVKYKVDLRTAAMTSSVQKVAKVMGLSGNVFAGGSSNK